MPNVKVLSIWSELYKKLLGETHVSGRTFIFCTFLRYGGALDLLRHVVDLSVSLAMSQPPETMQKLSMSKLDFSILVLQSSNSADLNAFFQVLFSLIRSVCRGNVDLLLSES